jgi:maltose O-acetyltransferase
MTGTIHDPSVIVAEENLALHDESRIDAFCYINCTGGVEIGPESVIHCGSHVVGAGGLVMGERSVVTYNCVLATAVPGMDGPMSSMVDKREVNRRVGQVTLGDETFVGSCAVLMPGVTVHDAGVVAAGTYVDRDVPEATVLLPDGSFRDRPGDW